MITIGIDLGTTNSCVAWNDGTRTEVIEVPGGGLTLPSVVGFNERGEIQVGGAARRRIVHRDPKYIFSNIKRHIGLPFVEGEDYGPQIAGSPDGTRCFIGPDRNYSPQELSAEILKVLKLAAERRIGKPVRGAVITVPAYFDNNRVAATKEAGELAGFRKVHIFTEPEAAALAFGIEKEKFSRVAVFDLGGGTFDIVIMEAGEGRIKIIEKNGWDRLGGLNFDRRIEDYVVERYQAENDVNLREKPISMMKIAPAAEAAKKDLSEDEETWIEAVNAAFDHEASRMKDINYALTRAELEARCRDPVEQAMEITGRCLAAANLSVGQIHEVLLVGGMTRMPMVRRAVAAIFGDDKLRDRVSPDLAVAQGAAIKAAMIDNRLVERVLTNDVTARDFGVEIEGGVLAVILPKGTAHGELRSAVLTTAHDQQAILPVAVLQGEAGSVAGAALIGAYVHEVTPNTAGAVSLELEMMVDEDGLLMATGRDLDTGRTFDILGSRT